MEVQKIYLLRHAQTDANKNNICQGISFDPPLNKTGRKQAQDLARYSGKHYRYIAKIIASPSARTVETAALISQELWYVNGRALDSEVEPDLHEINMGDWEGKAVTQIEKECPELYEKWRHGDVLDIEFPNGEKVKDAIERSFGAFTKILESNKTGDLAIVGHGGTNSIILTKILGGKNFRDIIQHNTCVNIIERKNNRLRISLINGTAHLL